jgi:hypothetical protein
MTAKKRLVLFVEGDGDETAVPHLVKRLLTEHSLWEPVFLDPNPFRVGEVSALLADPMKRWIGRLRAAANRGNLGGILLLLDGDTKPAKGKPPFCAFRVAAELGKHARQVGAGTLFSVASVFARQEYESWLIACAKQLAGQLLDPGGRPGIRAGTTAPEHPNLEEAPRDAKGWLRKCMDGGYKETRDQEALTRLVLDHLPILRHLRSFQRLENALQQLVHAIRSGTHVVTPAEPESS